MSGPVRPTDVSEDPARPDEGLRGAGPPPEIRVTPSRTAEVGGVTVRRTLPRRDRRTVGAWCFADHMGPHDVTPDDGVDIGPHPHMGLQTVTWLTAGEILHRDSLGSEQTIRPGQLNLMTAGRGVSHAEESTGSYSGEMQGIQLWVAQPEATRHGDPAFEHHAELPVVDLDGATASVLVGGFGGITSPARRDTDLLGVDLELRGRTTTALAPGFEHALIVLEGAVTLACHECPRDDETHAGGDRTDGPVGPVGPGNLIYLATGHDELSMDPSGPTRLLLLGGTPFESRVLMWWNFVGRTTDEIDGATQDWNVGSERFGHTGSPLDRLAAPSTPW